MTLALRLVLVFALGYAVLCLVVFLLQARLVYFPGPPPEVVPSDFGLAFERRQLVTSDGERLEAWLVPCPEAHGVVLVCNGNAGSIEQRIDLAQAFHRLGWTTLLFDYRGYGHSSGRPDEEGTYRDAEAAHDLLRAEGFAPERIVLYGESMGAGVAVELALRRPCAAMIVESAFTSIPDMAAEVYPFLPGRWLARIRYDNRAKVGRIGVPLLLIHSPQDEIVPIAHAEALFAEAREPKRRLTTGGGHNEGGFRLRPDGCAAVGDFLGSLAAGR